MIVVMRSGFREAELQRVVEYVEEAGLQVHLSRGEEHAIVGVVGVPIPDHLQEDLEILPGVQQVLRVSKRYKRASRDFQPVPTVVQVGSAAIGPGEVTIIAGPCSVESEEQYLGAARALRDLGATMLRGGAFKPRTSPYEFRGLGELGLQIMARAREETGLPIVTEVMAPADVELVARYADMLQIGARNSQNYLLLEAVGATDKPVLLKRGMAMTIEEWLLAAEYVMASGNPNVVLCERGIRTYETATRNTLDLSAVPAVKKLSHLPIVADPSHGTGKWYLVKPMALAALAVGAHGLLIEVHPSPDHALSDGPQSLNFENFADMMDALRNLARPLGRVVADVPRAPVSA